MQVKSRHILLQWHQVKLTVDCVFNHELAKLQADSGLSRLLAKGKVSHVDKPLEALICKQFGFKNAEALPIAAICANVDSLVVGSSYWLRADPVHFQMQRDCFSLSEPVPLQIKPEHTLQMLTSLNQHFSQDGLTFYSGKSGAWYVKSEAVQRVQMTLPSVAMDKNVHHFMPQGEDAANWKAILNEVQMLLHDHPVNEAREAGGEVAVNSVWFSGGGVLPLFERLTQEFDLMITDHVLSIGLAKLANIPYQNLPNQLEDILQKNTQHVRLHLLQTSQMDKKWFEPIFLALKNKHIEHLTINLGFYEKTLVLDMKPLDIYKFWRKPHAVNAYVA